MSDRGLTHIALPVHDLDVAVDFYVRYAEMQVVHHRVDGGAGVAWLSDLTRDFVVVLIVTEVSHTLGGWSHLGVACSSRAEVDERCATARAAGVAVDGPHDDGPPVGYWAILTDPDGHHLELAHGQDVGGAIAAARGGSVPPGR